MPGMGGAVGFCHSRGSSSGLNEWNFLRFSPHENLHMRRESTYDGALINLVKSKRNEIRGTVQLTKTLDHYGLVIELAGNFETQERKTYPLLPPNPSPSGISRSLQDLSTSSSSLSSPIQHRFYPTHGKSVSIPLTSTPLKKYPFHLKLPPNILIPPSFQCPLGKAQYFLRVLVQSSKDSSLLRELAWKEINYPGQETVNPGNSISTKNDINLDGVNISVQVPRSEFILGESIPCAISVENGEEKGSLKDITVWLTRVINYTPEIGKNPLSTTKVVHCVTFKRFLKRDSFTRSVKFSTDKVRIPSFKMEEEPKLRIRYIIQVKVTTVSEKSDTIQIDLTLGTDATDPTPSAPNWQPDPSAPSEENEQVEKPTAPMMGVGSLVGSVMSLFPPSYSSLPSRAVSMVSLETLPPNYDDI